MHGRMTCARTAASAGLALLVLTVAIAAVPSVRGQPAKTVVIEMIGVQFVPSTVHVDPGDIVTVRVFNNDTGIVHTFDLDAFNVHLGTPSVPMQPGTNASDTFTADREGTFWFRCSVTGHATPRGDGTYTGMAGTLVVGQGAPPPDLTLLILIGVAGAAAVGVAAVVVWIRRRAKPP